MEMEIELGVGAAWKLGGGEGVRDGRKRGERGIMFLFYFNYLKFKIFYFNPHVVILLVCRGQHMCHSSNLTKN